jgi:Protein of unknown function (DUF1360)
VPTVSSHTEQTQADGPYAGYAEPRKRPPFGIYAALSAIFIAGHAAALGALKRSGRGLPAQVSPQDVVLIGTASHKLSRLISKDKITAFLRAPFTEYEGRGGPAEVEERARGTGVRQAIGELLICPYCLGLWASGGFHVALVYAPRTTRLVASTFTALTISDFLQIGYKAAEDRGLGGS